MTRLILALAVFLTLASAAIAAPPENADPSLGPWFQSLRQPGTGMSCCSEADCRMVEAGSDEKGWYVMVENKRRLYVPPEVVLVHDNPTGSAVLCASSGFTVIYCFVPPFES